MEYHTPGVYLSIPPGKIAPALIETAQLHIRKPAKEDILGVATAIQASLPDLQPWMHWATPPPSAKEIEQAIITSNEAFDQGTAFRYHLFTKASDGFAGSIGLSNIDWRVPKMELSFWLVSVFEKRGFMQEAVIATTKIALEFLGAHRVEIRVSEQNYKARNVAEKAGFQKEGRIHNDHRLPNGNLSHAFVYAKTK